jgi:hypothetical protein
MKTRPTRQPPRDLREFDRAAVTRTGAAAIAAGVLFALSNLFGDFLLPAERDGDIVHLGLSLVYFVAYGLGALALVYALRGLRILLRHRIARVGSHGLRVATVGAALHVLFAALYAATAAVTGDAADSAFFLYALGFLLLIVGGLMAGFSMIRIQPLRRMGLLLLLTAAAAIVLIVTPAPAHDVGYFVYDAAWILIGLNQLTRGRLWVRT